MWFSSIPKILSGYYVLGCVTSCLRLVAMRLGRSWNLVLAVGYVTCLPNGSEGLWNSHLLNRTIALLIVTVKLLNGFRSGVFVGGRLMWCTSYGEEEGINRLIFGQFFWLKN